MARVLNRAALVFVAFAACAAPAQASEPGSAIRHELKSAPFFTETFTPRRAPKGVAITFHRGAWEASGAAAAATEHPDDRAWLRRGWLVVNSSYRPGAAGLADVRDVYRRVDRAMHRSLPICLVGASSGGQLALLASPRLPRLSCIIAEAAPTDLVNITAQATSDPSGPQYIHDAAAQAFGAENLTAFSPLFLAQRIKAHVLLAESEQDPLIPAQQGTDMCNALATRCVASMELPHGPLMFVHAGVSREALSAFRKAETLLAKQAAATFPPRSHFTSAWPASPARLRACAQTAKCVLLCSNCHAEVEGGVAALL